MPIKSWKILNKNILQYNFPSRVSRLVLNDYNLEYINSNNAIFSLDLTFIRCTVIDGYIKKANVQINDLENKSSIGDIVTDDFGILMLIYQIFLEYLKL